MEPVHYAIYLVVKYLTYTAWCYLGIRLLAPERPRPFRAASILGGARRHLAFTNPARRYLAEASLPLYVLHQIGIVVPGFFIIQTTAGIPAKLALLLASSIALTLLAYHLGVRRSRVLRAALGVAAPTPGATAFTA